jgi:hypothetical protein
VTITVDKNGKKVAAKTKKKVEREIPQDVQVRLPLDPNTVNKIVVPLNPSLPVVTDLDISNCPTFSTQEVASVFFQRSAAWFRWIDRRGLLDRDALGREVKVMRLNDPDNGMKRYTLADIEMTARILHQNGVISASRLTIALQIIHLIAIGYGVIPVE